MVSSETRCAWCCQVPASFAHLSCLRSLLISHNRFTHVPMELSALPALELLNANGNEIAMVDCVLPSVRRLLLDGNRLTTIPRGVLLCRRLQVKLTLLVQGLRRIRKILYSLRYAIAFSLRSYMCVCGIRYCSTTFYIIADYAIARCPSVCTLSVTRWYRVEKAKRRQTFLPSLFHHASFSYQMLWQHSDKASNALSRK